MDFERAFAGHMRNLMMIVQGSHVGESLAILQISGGDTLKTGSLEVQFVRC
jgi:hypothetical protein